MTHDDIILGWSRDVYLKMHLFRSNIHFGYDILCGAVNEKDPYKYYMIHDVKVTEIEQGDDTRPFRLGSIQDKQAIELMDSMYSAGVRPSDFKDPKAVEAHIASLEDQIQFLRSLIRKPK